MKTNKEKVFLSYIKVNGRLVDYLIFDGSVVINLEDLQNDDFVTKEVNHEKD